MTTIANPAISEVHAVEDLEQRWEEAWNQHDADAVAALCSEHLVYDEPAIDGTVFGREPIREFVRTMKAAFPDYVFTLEGLYADVSRPAILVAWSFRGTYAKTGGLVEFHGDDRLDIGPDGLIDAYRCLYDYRFVLQQMGHGK